MLYKSPSITKTNSSNFIAYIGKTSRYTYYCLALCDEGGR